MSTMDSNNNFDNLPDFLTPQEVKFINRYREYVQTHKLQELDNEFLKKVKTKIESITQEQIDNLRNEVLAIVEKKKVDHEICERFVKELTLDVYLRGFLGREHKNPAERVVAAIEFLSCTVDINEQTYPREFGEFNMNIGSGFDKFGNPILYAFAQRNLIPKKLLENSRKFVIYAMYQFVRVSMFTNGFFTFLIDFTGASYANVDFDALRLLISILNDHAPACLNRIICHNVHWAIRPAVRLGIALLPAQVSEMMHTTTSKDIEKFIEKDQLISMIEGGQNNEIIIGKPQKNSGSLLDYCPKLNLSIDEATKLIEQSRKSFFKNKLELIIAE